MTLGKKGAGLKMSEKFGSTSGSCIISEEVVATIACNAALEVAGVADVAPLPMDIRGMIRTGAARSVIVQSTADRTIVDISVSPVMNAHIPTVAQNVQEAVKNAVQAMTGSPVTSVNVRVARPLEAAPAPESAPKSK